MVVHLKNRSKVLTGARKVTYYYYLPFFYYYYFYVVKLSLCNSICEKQCSGNNVVLFKTVSFGDPSGVTASNS